MQKPQQKRPVSQDPAVVQYVQTALTTLCGLAQRAQVFRNISVQRQIALFVTVKFLSWLPIATVTTGESCSTLRHCWLTSLPFLRSQRLAAATSYKPRPSYEVFGHQKFSILLTALLHLIFLSFSLSFSSLISISSTSQPATSLLVPTLPFLFLISTFCLPYCLPILHSASSFYTSNKIY